MTETQKLRLVGSLLQFCGLRRRFVARPTGRPRGRGPGRGTGPGGRTSRTWNPSGIAWSAASAARVRSAAGVSRSSSRAPRKSPVYCAHIGLLGDSAQWLTSPRQPRSTSSAGFQVIAGEAGVVTVGVLQERQPQRQRVQPGEVRDRWPDLAGPHPVCRGARGPVSRGDRHVERFRRAVRDVGRVDVQRCPSRPGPGQSTLARRWCRSATRRTRSAIRQGRGSSGLATQMSSTPGLAGRTGVARASSASGSWSTPPDYGCGVLTTLQAVPFHASASVISLPVPVKSPTAMQLDAPVQEVPRSSSLERPGAGGMQQAPARAVPRLRQGELGLARLVKRGTGGHALRRAGARHGVKPGGARTGRVRGRLHPPVPRRSTARRGSRCRGCRWARRARPRPCRPRRSRRRRRPGCRSRPGVGVSRRCHAAPFHDSASVTLVPVPLL